jgi:hypothetical protein
MEVEAAAEVAWHSWVGSGRILAEARSRLRERRRDDGRERLVVFKRLKMGDGAGKDGNYGKI